MPTSLEYLGELRTEATKRLGAVLGALGDASHEQHTRLLGGLKLRWLGAINEDQLTANLSALSIYLGDPSRLTIDLMNATTAKSPIAMVAGRPVDSARPMKTLAYPGLAGQLSGEGRAPGMSFNPNYLKPDVPANREYRLWTLLHESSHAVLGTYDYQYYDFKTVIRDSEATRALSITKTPREVEAGTLQRNADSWAAYVAQAVRLLGASADGGGTRAPREADEDSAEAVAVEHASEQAVLPLSPSTCTRCTSKIPLLNGRTVCPICERGS